MTRISSLSRPAKILLATFGVLLLLAAVRQITGAEDLTSSGTAGAALRLAVPIGLAGLGGLYSERSGIWNIGLEGTMILGTWFGAYGAWELGPWWGVAFGMLGGALGGVIHAVATVVFNVDHIISGVAIVILSSGLARYLSVIAYDGGSGGGPTQSPRVENTIPNITLPFSSGGEIFGWKSPDFLGSIDRANIFLVSDGAGILGGFTRGVSLLTVIAALLIPFSAWLLWRTRFGLRLRSSGESPSAAESLGVSVARMRFAGVMISGALSGLGGAFLSIVASSIYREGQTAGRGYIGLATMIFGNWRPGGVAAGAGLFGFADALQLRSAASVRALLLAIAVLLGIFAWVMVVRRRAVPAAASFVFGALFLTWFLSTDRVPSQITFCTPYAVTLIVLAFASQRLRPPKEAGLPYRRGEAR